MKRGHLDVRHAVQVTTAVVGLIATEGGDVFDSDVGLGLLVDIREKIPVFR